MALPPQHQNEAFLREVGDELRRDRVESFWRRWGVAVLIAVVIGLLVLAGLLFWRHREQQAAERTAETFAGLLADAGEGRTAAVPAGMAPIAAGSVPAYRAGAAFTLADLATIKGDERAAIAQFRRIEGDQALPEPYRQTALIRRTALEFDRIAPQEVINRLGGFAQPGNPWFGSAGELVAMAYLKMNKPQQAGRLFGGLANDPGVPDTLRSRAVQMASTLGVEADTSGAGVTVGGGAK